MRNHRLDRKKHGVKEMRKRSERAGVKHEIEATKQSERTHEKGIEVRRKRVEE